MAALSITVAILHTYQSSKRLTHWSSGISHCFLYFTKQNSPVGNDCCWIQEGRGKAALLPLPLPDPASMEQPFASEATIFIPCRSSWLSSQSHVQQQRLDSSVLWALPSPIPCTPHSSSGFAILFSAASCTKLCCECAVGLDMAERIQRSPFSSYQTTL